MMLPYFRMAMIHSSARRRTHEATINGINNLQWPRVFLIRLVLFIVIAAFFFSLTILIAALGVAYAHAPLAAVHVNCLLGAEASPPTESRPSHPRTIARIQISRFSTFA